MTKPIFPILRFKDFDDELIKFKIGEVSDSYSGGTPSVLNKNFYSGTIPFIRSAEINKDETELCINEDALNQSSAKLVEKGDILYALYGATSGEVGISRIDGAINQAILAIKPYEGYSSEFIMQWLRREKNSIIDKYLQGGQGNLSGGIVKNLDVQFPTYSEQSSIGTLFQTLDELLSAYKDNVANYQAFKASMLSKMFPKAGQTIPEIRLDGFDGEWDEKKLEELAYYRRGSFPQPYGNKEWYDGANSMPFVQVVDVLDNFNLSNETKQRISELAMPKSVFVPTGTILVTLQGSIGRVAITKFPCYVDRTILIIESFKREMDKYFMAISLKSKFETEKQKAPGGTIKTITKEVLNDFTIVFPSPEEQRAIGAFFSNLDDLISNYQDKIKQLETLKKKLLQEMFL